MGYDGILWTYMGSSVWDPIWNPMGTMGYHGILWVCIDIGRPNRNRIDPLDSGNRLNRPVYSARSAGGLPVKIQTYI